MFNGYRRPNSMASQQGEQCIQSVPFCSTLPNITSGLKHWEMDCVRPSTYFKSIALQLWTELQIDKNFAKELQRNHRSANGLQCVRYLHATAKSDADRALTWLFATHLLPSWKLPQPMLPMLLAQLQREYKDVALVQAIMRMADQSVKAGEAGRAFDHELDHEFDHAPEALVFVDSADAHLFLEAANKKCSADAPLWMCLSTCVRPDRNAANGACACPCHALEPLSQLRRLHSLLARAHRRVPQGKNAFELETLLSVTDLSTPNPTAHGPVDLRQTSHVAHNRIDRFGLDFIINQLPFGSVIAGPLRRAMLDTVFIGEFALFLDSIANEAPPAGRMRQLTDRQISHAHSLRVRHRNEWDSAIGATLDLVTARSTDAIPADSNAIQEDCWNHLRIVDAILHEANPRRRIGEYLRRIVAREGPALQPDAATKCQPTEPLLEAMELIGRALILRELRSTVGGPKPLTSTSTMGLLRRFAMPSESISNSLKLNLLDPPIAATPSAPEGPWYRRQANDPKHTNLDSIKHCLRCLYGCRSDAIMLSIASVFDGPTKAVAMATSGNWLKPGALARWMRTSSIPSSNRFDFVRQLTLTHGDKLDKLLPMFARERTWDDHRPLFKGQQRPTNATEQWLVQSIELPPKSLALLSPRARKAYLANFIRRYGDLATKFLAPNFQSRIQREKNGQLDFAGNALGTVACAVNELPWRTVRAALPLHVIETVISESKFGAARVPASVPPSVPPSVPLADVKKLFSYHGESALVVWARAWHRIVSSAATTQSGKARATKALIRNISKGKFNLQRFCELASHPPSASKSKKRFVSDFATTILAIPAIVQALVSQSKSLDQTWFLLQNSRGRALVDLPRSQLENFVLSIDSGLRDISDGPPGDSSADAKKLNRPSRKALRSPLNFVAQFVDVIARRLCTVSASDDAAITAQKIDLARLLLRVIATRELRAPASVETIELLTQRLSTRRDAQLTRKAAQGRCKPLKEPAEETTVLAVALELAKQGLADEFQQVLMITRTASLDDRYRAHRIPKKRGGMREIHQPDADLMRLQRKVLARFLARAPISEHAHGFVRGRGILTNALEHTGKRVVLNVDIRNFFGSLPIEHIRAALNQTRLRSRVPKTENQGWAVRDRESLSPAALDVLVKIVTRAGSLPQGAPTSPAITNIALRHTDGILAKACRRIGVSYTRYADDLTFSGADGPVQGIVPFVRELLTRIGLELHPDKTHVYRSGRQQLVTGLVVNSSPNLPRRDRRRMRAAAHRLGTTGKALRWKGSPMSLAGFQGRLSLLNMVDESRADSLRLLAKMEPR